MTRARTRLSALSSAVSQSDIVSMRIDNDGLKTNREVFTSFRRVVKEAVATMIEPSGGTSEPRKIDAALDAMARLMDSELEAKQKTAKMKDALRVISSFLIDEEARAKNEDLA